MTGRSCTCVRLLPITFNPGAAEAAAFVDVSSVTFSLLVGDDAIGISRNPFLIQSCNTRGSHD